MYANSMVLSIGHHSVRIGPMIRAMLTNSYKPCHNAVLINYIIFLRGMAGMRKQAFYFLALALVMAPGFATAAGFRVVEQGNMAQGMAHAVTASVSDASSVYYNPAAMVNIEKYAVSTGFQFVDPKTEYSGAGGDVETSNTTFAIPHLYLVKSFQDSGLSVGFGLFANFGLGSTWSDGGPFNYTATDTQLQTHTLNLNVAKKFGDKLSVAVGVNHMTSEVTYKSMYPFGYIVPGSAPGYQILTGDGTGFGFNVALLYEVSERVKVAFTYRSKVSTTLSGDFTVENWPTALQGLLALKGISGDDYKTLGEVDLEYPDITVLGVSFQATDRLLLELDLDHTGWSSYDQLDFVFGDSVVAPTGATLLPKSSSSEKNWNNVMAIRVGGAYSYTEQLTLRSGFYYDPTPIPDETFEPRLPGSNRYLVAIGAGYKATDNFTVDASFSRIWSDSRDIDNDIGDSLNQPIDGKYSTALNIFGISFGYLF